MSTALVTLAQPNVRQLQTTLSFNDVSSAAGVGDTGNGWGVALGDLNNDGHLDIYVTNAGANKLFMSDGSGGFTEVGSTAGVADTGKGRGVALGDLNNDGHLDIHVTNDGANKLFMNDGSGSSQ